MNKQNIDTRIEQLEQKVNSIGEMIGSLTMGLLLSTVDQDLTIELFQKIGIKKVNGIPIEQWWKEASKESRELMLIQFEDADPGAAAFLQSLFDNREK